MKYLHHLTINTGHSRRSYRREVADWAIAALHEPLAVARTEQEAEVPGQPGYVFVAAEDGPQLIAHIYGPISHGSRPLLITMGVARRSRGAENLWQLLWSGAEGPAVPLSAQPEAPWCAVRFGTGLLTDPSAAEWLGDFERCLAWTWLEKQ